MKYSLLLTADEPPVVGTARCAVTARIAGGLFTVERRSMENFNDFRLVHCDRESASCAAARGADGAARRPYHCSIRKLPYILAIAAAAFTANAQLSTNAPVVNAKSGRALFLKNCAHCHGADAHGDEGPDLHKLAWTDKQITDRIRNGKKGQMTSFAGKLTTNEIQNLAAYVRTLK